VIVRQQPQRVIALKVNKLTCKQKQKQEDTNLEKTQKFTIQELSGFNGKNGKPAYVAYKGKVYDVTDSNLWTDGDHLGHAAGEDLTEAMDTAPHSEDIMEKTKPIGVLV